MEELEEEEESESEEEEWFDTKSEEPPPYSGPLSDERIAALRVRLEEAATRDDDFDIEITEEHVKSFMLDIARRTGAITLKEFNALDWEAIFLGEYDFGDEPAVVEVIDSYDEVSGTELVRTGDIIEVRAVDPSRVGKIVKVHSSEDSMGSEVIINTEAPSPDIIEDVAHHTELTETSIDATHDELFIKTGGDTADEFSEEEKLSVSIDANASVDRHREDNTLDEFSQENKPETPVSIDVGKSVDRQQEDNCPNKLFPQPSVQNEFTEFIIRISSTFSRHTSS